MSGETKKERETNPYYFGEEMPDGRLTAEYDNTAYHFRDMLRRRNELGRPLTENGMKEFEIHKNKVLGEYVAVQGGS